MCDRIFFFKSNTILSARTIQKGSKNRQKFSLMWFLLVALIIVQKRKNRWKCKQFVEDHLKTDGLKCLVGSSKPHPFGVGCLMNESLACLLFRAIIFGLVWTRPLLVQLQWEIEFCCSIQNANRFRPWKEMYNGKWTDRCFMCTKEIARLKRTFINLMIRWKKRLVHLKDLIKSLKIFYTFVSFSPKIVLNNLDLNTNIEWINFLAPKALTRLQNSFKSRISCCEFFVIRRKIPAIYRNGKYKCYGFESIKLRENFENRFRVSVCVHTECCACLVSICTELFAFIKWYLSRLWQR